MECTYLNNEWRQNPKEKASLSMCWTKYGGIDMSNEGGGIAPHSLNVSAK
jgi:hypothetical protein